MRTFIAIKLPTKIKDALAGIQDKLKTSLPKISWVRPENLHLSLKFLGDISDGQVAEIKQLIDRLSNTESPIEIKLDLAGVFPDWRQARVIWVGAQNPPLQLIQLVQQVENECLKLKIPAETRPFQAHITLGRIRNPLPQTALKETLQARQKEIANLDLKFRVKWLALFQSVLGPQGPAYSILKESELLQVGYSEGNPQY